MNRKREGHKIANKNNENDCCISSPIRNCRKSTYCIFANIKNLVSF